MTQNNGVEGNESSGAEQEFERPDIAEMSADDWREWLTEHSDYRLDLDTVDQTLTVKYNHEKEKLMLYQSRLAGKGEGGGVGWGEEKVDSLLGEIEHGPDPDDQIHVRPRDDIEDQSGDNEEITVLEIDQFTQTGDIDDYTFEELRKLIEDGEDPEIENIEANARKLFDGRFDVKTVSPDDDPTSGYVWFTEGDDGGVAEFKTNYATF